MIYKNIESAHGQAATYYLKARALQLEDTENTYNNVNSEIECKQAAEKAMRLYFMIRHREGHEMAADICTPNKSLDDKPPKLKKPKDPLYIPYQEIVTDYDYMSLGIEPILTTKFEENIDITHMATIKPKCSRKLSTKKSSSLKRSLSKKSRGHSNGHNMTKDQHKHTHSMNKTTQKAITNIARRFETGNTRYESFRGQIPKNKISPKKSKTRRTPKYVYSYCKFIYIECLAPERLHIAPVRHQIALSLSTSS